VPRASLSSSAAQATRQTPSTEIVSASAFFARTERLPSSGEMSADIEPAVVVKTPGPTCSTPQQIAAVMERPGKRRENKRGIM